MSDNTTASGAPANQSGDSVENGSANPTGSGGSENRVISWEDHKRALDDMHKFKREAAELRRLDEEKRTASLREKERFKELSEQLEKELQKEREANQRTNSVFKTTLKSSRIVELALKAGLRPEAREDLEMLNLDDIEVEETSSGRYIVRGADTFVDGLKKKRPHWFSDPKAPTFNGGGGRPAPVDEPMTAEKVAAIEKKFGRNDPRFVEAWNKWAKGGK